MHGYTHTVPLEDETMADEQRTTTLTIRVLVSDTGAEVLQRGMDLENVAEQVRDALAPWGWACDATRLELRELTFSVPLLEPVVPATTEVASVTLPEELAGVVEELRRKGRADSLDAAQRLVMEALPPGTWESYRGPGTCGIRRIEPPKDGGDTR